MKGTDHFNIKNIFMASVDDVREDAAGAQGGHLRAEDVVRDMTSAIDRFVATSKANVHQYRKKDRELTVEQDSAFPAT